MRTFSRDDIATSQITWQEFTSSGVTVINSANESYQIIDQYGIDTMGTTSALRRQKGLVYVNFAVHGWFPNNQHIIIGNVPEGFRPKERTYVVGGIGRHGVTQVYIDTNGDIDLWFNGVNPDAFDFNNQYEDGQITGKFINRNNVTYVDPNDGVTKKVYDYTAFRCNTVYFVQD